MSEVDARHRLEAENRRLKYALRRIVHALALEPARRIAAEAIADDEDDDA